jgi:type VI secretion system protein ImpA
MFAASVEHAGYEQALSFPRLAPLVDKMLAFLDGAVARRDPGAALGVAGAPAGAPASLPGTPSPGGPAPTAPAASLPSGSVSSLEEAAAALAGVLGYFERREPSSPAILLIRQARQLMGRSFMEAIQMLVPSFADQAIIRVGGKQVFELSVERLAAIEGGGADEAPGPDDSAVEPRPVGSRPEALALLDQVRAYYRATEPTSPVPLLIERARALAEQDFMSLLKDVLPEGGLKSTEAQQW